TLTASTNTSITPPQTAWLHVSIASSSSTRTSRGSPSCTTSRAASITSASPQPPPIVPTRPCSGSISMRLPAWRGTEPFVRTTVASATQRPSRAARSAASETFASGMCFSGLRCFLGGDESLEHALTRGERRHIRRLAAHRDELRRNADRDLRRRLRIDVQADRRMQRRELFARDACIDECLERRTDAPATADHPDIARSNGVRQQPPETVEVPAVPARDERDVRAVVDRHAGERVRLEIGALHRDARCEALLRRELLAVVEHEHAEAELRTDRRERHRDVACTNDDQPIRRLVRLEEQLRLAGRCVYRFVCDAAARKQ